MQRQPDALLDFVYDRLRGYLRDLGYTANQIAAVLDARPDTIADLPSRLAAVQAFAALPEAASLAAANKRITNILKKTEAAIGGERGACRKRRSASLSPHRRVRPESTPPLRAATSPARSRRWRACATTSTPSSTT